MSKLQLDLGLKLFPLSWLSQRESYDIIHKCITSIIKSNTIFFYRFVVLCKDEYGLIGLRVQVFLARVGPDIQKNYLLYYITKIPFNKET